MLCSYLRQKLKHFLNDGFPLKLGFFLYKFNNWVIFQQVQCRRLLCYLFVKSLYGCYLLILILSFLILSISLWFQLILIYLLVFGSLCQVLELKMDVMLSFLLFFVVWMWESSLSVLSFSFFLLMFVQGICFSYHAFDSYCKLINCFIR